MKKILLILLLLVILTTSGMALTYTSQYPPAQSATYVKATTATTPGYYQYFATNPALSVTGTWDYNAWLSTNGSNAEQRFHIDLGSAKIIRRIYLENSHHNGIFQRTTGVENFTFWGSNTGAGTFDDLVYANDEGWTELTCSANIFAIHVNADQADPQYVTVTNTTAYRYYAFKFVDNWGASTYMGARQIELQTEDGYGEAEDNATFFGFNF